MGVFHFDLDGNGEAELLRELGYFLRMVFIFFGFVFWWVDKGDDRIHFQVHALCKAEKGYIQVRIGDFDVGTFD